MPFKDKAKKRAYEARPEYREKRKLRDYKNKDRTNSPIWKRKNQYRLTSERYDQMLAAQDNRCGVCLRVFVANPQVDHDHSCCAGNKRSCGKCVRGLLCRECNIALGLFGDNPNVAKRAAEYLILWEEKKCQINKIP